MKNKRENRMTAADLRRKFTLADLFFMAFPTSLAAAAKRRRYSAAGKETAAPARVLRGGRRGF